MVLQCGPRAPFFRILLIFINGFQKIRESYPPNYPPLAARWAGSASLIAVSASKPATLDKPCLSKRGEAFQQGLNRSGAAPLELAGHLFGGGGA